MRCLPEDRISGSIDPRTIRRGDDPGGYYGASHAKVAIGRYWPDTSPNLLVISVEVAGFAREGPTEAQQRSMVALWDDIRSRYPKVLPLGHRDWQDVKPCPGGDVTAVDRFLRYTTQKEPALTASSRPLGLAARCLGQTDGDLAILGPISAHRRGVVIRAGVSPPTR